MAKWKYCRKDGYPVVCYFECGKIKQEIRLLEDRKVKSIIYRKDGSIVNYFIFCTRYA
jgi:hypothetical protein